MGKVVVLGVGNLLLGDEGVGIHLLRLLEKSELPPEVKLIDGGTAVWGVLDEIESADRLIVVDALKNGGKPGTLYRLKVKKEMFEKEDRPLSLHQVDLVQVLKWLKKTPEEVIVVGIEPRSIDWGMKLSPEVRGKLPRLKEIVLGEIYRLQNTGCGKRE